MQKLKTYYPFLLPAILLIVAVVIIFPYCRYYIDPDATAYLTIARRYATGDIEKAVNGYWSPWSCWLTALFIKAGWDEMTGAVIANTMAAIGFLFITQAYLLIFGINRKLQWALCAALVVFLSYAVYFQLFDDLWECFFLLSVLYLLLRDDFAQKPLLWVGAGMLGSLAYFSKAYAFPFFLLHFVTASLLITKGWEKEARRKWLSICGVAIGTMVLCSSPWLYSLHVKYGQWMTSTAGKLNMSWYVVGHPYWKDGITHLLPPVYPDSPSYWEDPWMVNGITPHFWNSLSLFIRQIAKLVLNEFRFLLSGLQIAVWFLLVWFLSLIAVLKRRTYYADAKSYVLMYSFILFPLPFLLINFEARYIWYTLPLSMVAGSLVLQRLAAVKFPGRENVLIGLFAIAYIIWPLYDFKTIWNEGKAEYLSAQQIKQAGINGSFTAWASFGNQSLIQLQRIGFFAGNPYYNMPYVNVPDNELLKDMRRYGIKYYYYTAGDTVLLKDEAGKAFPVKDVGGWRIAILEE